MIQLATIGTSMITGQLIAAVAQVPGIAFLGAYSRDADRAAAYAAEHGGRQSWSDLDALMQDPGVDAVYIASPNALHAEQAHAALVAGKHVLLEKPAATTSAAWADLTALARDRGLVLIEAMRSAYDPGMAAVRSILPRLGTLRRASFGYSQRSSRYDQVLRGEQVNIFDPAMGAGALMDLGVYCTSTMVQLFGRPQRVFGATVGLPTGTDGAGAAIAVYPDLVVDLSWSKITASTRPCEIQGELGSLTYHQVAAPRQMEVTLLDGTTESITVDAPGWNLAFEVERFVAAVGGADISTDQDWTTATLEILETLAAPRADHGGRLEGRP